jgi:hypothetical protein
MQSAENNNSDIMLNPAAVNLSGVDLSGRNLSGMNLSGMNLSGRNLSGMNLSGMNLSNKNLSGADLSGADLSGANLSDANLSGATISDAIFYNTTVTDKTNFTNVKGIPKAYPQYYITNPVNNEFINASKYCKEKYGNENFLYINYNNYSNYMAFLYKGTTEISYKNPSFFVILYKNKKYSITPKSNINTRSVFDFTFTRVSSNKYIDPINIKFSNSRFQLWELPAKVTGLFKCTFNYVNNPQEIITVTIEEPDRILPLNCGVPFIDALLFGGAETWWHKPNANRNAIISTDQGDKIFEIDYKPKGANSYVKHNLYSLKTADSNHYITYKFFDNKPIPTLTDKDYTNGFKPMTDNQKNAVRKAFNYISSFANINFIETDSTNQFAEISFGTSNQGNKTSGISQYPGDNNRVISCLNNADTTNDTFKINSNSYGWCTILHEIGHTLGLKHTGNYNGLNGTADGPFLDKDDYILDNDSSKYSIMSYNNAENQNMILYVKSDKNNYYTWDSDDVVPSTYMKYDVAALQYLYGKRVQPTDNELNSLIFNSDFYGLKTIIRNDTDAEFDVSNITNPNIINLNPGEFSSINIGYTIVNNISTLPKNVAKLQTYDGKNNVALSYDSVVNTVILNLRTQNINTDTVIINNSNKVLIKYLSNKTKIAISASLFKLQNKNIQISINTPPQNFKSSNLYIYHNVENKQISYYNNNNPIKLLTYTSEKPINLVPSNFVIID